MIHFFFDVFFSQKIGFDISDKLSFETICMKCKGLFSGKKEEIYFKMSAENSTKYA